jgi:hypothetical protein
MLRFYYGKDVEINYIYFVFEVCLSLSLNYPDIPIHSIYPSLSLQLSQFQQQRKRLERKYERDREKHNKDVKQWQGLLKGYNYLLFQVLCDRITLENFLHYISKQRLCYMLYEIFRTIPIF